jgi:hypothetical protein
MADPVSGLSLALSFIPAAAGLGTAAMGVVDSSKALPGGGPSLLGFKFIESALAPFLGTHNPPASASASASATTLGASAPPAGANNPPAPGTKPSHPHVVFGREQLIRTLKSNWINGVNKPDQKAAAKALIHLELTQYSAPAFAAAAGVNPQLLASLAANVAAGQPPTSAEVTVLGQFDVVLSAMLDDSYERGDQRYRNACKALAMGVSIVLSVIASELLGAGSKTFSNNTGIAILVGLCATPLAPIAKDLATSLQSAASALGFIKG